MFLIIVLLFLGAKLTIKIQTTKKSYRFNINLTQEEKIQEYNSKWKANKNAI